MAQARCGARLPAELVRDGRPGRQLGIERLHREIPVQVPVVDPEHHGVAAAPDGVLDLVAGPQRPLDLPSQLPDGIIRRERRSPAGLLWPGVAEEGLPPLQGTPDQDAELPEAA